MKTKEDIQAKLDHLKTTLDLIIKENNLAYAMRHKEVTAISDQIYLLEWVLDDTK